MTTTSTDNPMIPPQIPNWIKSWEAFIKAHERIILIGVASLLLWHLGSNGIAAWKSNKDLAAQAQINQQIAVTDATNKQTLAQLAQMQTQFDATIATLNAKIAQKQLATEQQQKIDAQLPLPDLSSRWENLLALSQGSITPQSNGTISVTTDAAHSTVSELEKIPLLTEQVADTQTELKSCQSVSAQKDVTLAGVQKELELTQKGRAEDAKVAKDNERKSFWKGTKFGSALTAVGILTLKVLIAK